ANTAGEAMQQSKRTATARLILGTSQSLYFWPKDRPALAETKGRGRTLCLRVNRRAARAGSMGWGPDFADRSSMSERRARPRVRYALDRSHARLAAFRREVPTAVEPQLRAWRAAARVSRAAMRPRR